MRSQAWRRAFCGTMGISYHGTHAAEALRGLGEGLYWRLGRTGEYFTGSVGPSLAPCMLPWDFVQRTMPVCALCATIQFVSFGQGAGG